jgi:tRNA threonylcarbamoyladenosine biosynthesis protein TsaB
MKLLVIDTATEACSVALQVGDLYISQFEICPQQHSQRLLPMVDEVLEEGCLSIKQLDCLAFGRGPGSFTGVRIATGMIQGLALGANLPVVAVSTLAAMAQQAIEQFQFEDIIAAIDARMGEVYFAHYKNVAGIAQLQGQEQVLPPAQAAILMSNTSSPCGVGSGWQAYPELDPTKQVKVLTEILYPDALYMLPLVKQALLQNQTLAVEDIQPVYLRDTVTWQKLPGKG